MRLEARWRIVCTCAAAAAISISVASVASAVGPPPATPDPIAAKRLACDPGQIDVNSASAQDLRALGLDLPVAERLIAHREPLYLDLGDLLVVEGIGADKLAEIKVSGRACAGLPTQPPPTDAHVCRFGDGRVDVNRPQSSKALAAMLGRPTADRIVAGIPYAGVGPVVAEHLPGIGPGRQRKLISQLCATPATIDHGDTRWGWISAAGGRVDHLDGATLTVPAGTLDSGAGVWGSVRALEWDRLLEGPSFDMTIHGPWLGDGKTVFTTLPRDPFQAPSHPEAWTPTVLHFTGGDADIHAKNDVHVGSDGRWTAEVASLSKLEALWQPLVSLATGIRSRINAVIQSAKNYLTSSYEPVPCSPDVSSLQRLRVGVYPDGLNSGLIGGFVRPPAKWCAQGDTTFSTSRVEFRLSNTSALTYGFNQWAGPADTVGVSLSPNLTSLTRVLLQFYNRGVKPGDDTTNVVYGPGVTVRFDLPASNENQQEDIVRDIFRYPINNTYDTLFLLTEHLGAVPGMDVPADVIECIQTYSVESIDVDAVLACITLVAKKNTSLRDKLESMGRALDLFSVFRAGVEAVTIANQTSTNSLEGTVNFSLRPFLILPPQQPTTGDPDEWDGARILKRTGSSASYVLDTDGVAHHIPDGETYVCNAKHYLVEFNVDDAEWSEQVTAVGDDATCPSGADRALAPETLASVKVLLRRVDGETWLTEDFNGAAHLVPLFSGDAVFSCMVEKYLVWDQVDYDEHARFDNHPFIAATGCGVGP